MPNYNCVKLSICVCVCVFFFVKMPLVFLTIDALGDHQTVRVARLGSSAVMTSPS